MRDTIDMAREAGYMKTVFGGAEISMASIDCLKVFEALVRADEREEFQRWFDAVTTQHKQEILAEREACAKVCDEVDKESQSQWPHRLATMIRARSQP